ncbi:cysteine-rich protein 2-like isoform X3 [Pyxicephalus adspersus]|uniref:cysteine-rich protein 2-like isoform X3 n=1 Tax=Pyxicephalus adspersus TaxID=30357 RepID=UPI003B5A7E49
MASQCPKCDKTVYFAEKVTSLGKDWHKFCLKCEHCNKTLTSGGHTESTSTPGPPEALRKLPLCKIGEVRLRGVNIGGAGSFIYKKPSIDKTISPTESASKIEDKKVAEPSKSLNKVKAKKPEERRQVLPSWDSLDRPSCKVSSETGRIGEAGVCRGC